MPDLLLDRKVNQQLRNSLAASLRRVWPSHGLIGPRMSRCHRNDKKKSDWPHLAVLSPFLWLMMKRISAFHIRFGHYRPMPRSKLAFWLLKIGGRRRLLRCLILTRNTSVLSSFMLAKRSICGVRRILR